MLQNEYGFQLKIPAIRSGNCLQAAMPFLQTRGIRGKRKWISLPFTDYVQALFEDAAMQRLFKALAGHWQPSFGTVIVRAATELGDFDSQSDSVRHVIDTGKAFSEIEAGFANSLKRNLKRVKTRGLAFKARYDAAAMSDFYRLHVITRKKHGIPVQPKSYFRRVYEELIKPGFGFVALVEKSSEPIAAGVYLSYNNRMTYKYGASNPNALEHRPNECLIHEALRITADQGYSKFDFGISSKQQEGLCRFKRKWGATESDVSYTYLIGKPEVAANESRLGRMAGQVIQRSPTVVCRALGKMFYKYSQ